MKVIAEVSADSIANLMTSAIESGDPVTTAARGGWCVSIQKEDDIKTRISPWYADAAYFRRPDFVITVHELSNDPEITAHRLTYAKMERGLEIMAKKFPRRFAEVLADDGDASTADIFLQCCLFEEEKYA